jgi:hypothetical protein
MTQPNNNTPISIINDAYLDAGLIQEGEPAKSDKLVVGMRKLQDIINLWQTEGLKLWLNVDTEVPLVSGKGTYSLSPTGDIAMDKPLRVIQAYYRDQNGIRRPLTPLSWDDYIRLSQINQMGQINSYFVNKKQLELSVFFWLVPDAVAATGTCHLLLQTQVTNFITLTETTNFPLEWRIALRWGLADELATGQPQAIMDRCTQRALMYKTKLEDWDVEDAPTHFVPDSRIGTSYGRFR